MFPCFSCGSSSPEYIRLQESDESDNEEEICTGSGASPSTVSDTADGQSSTSQQPQGFFSRRDAAGLTSMGYALLRVCDYVQLSTRHLRNQTSSTRGRRSFNDTVPIYNVTNSTNSSDYFLNGTEIPQWIYPCGITPNGTFPNHRRPFWIYNNTLHDYEQLDWFNYTAYLRGEYNDLAHEPSEGWGYKLRARPYYEGWRTLPYGFRGNGDFILQHFGNWTPEYPYASYEINNDLHYNGTCPRWIFNTTRFFGGGYVGLEEPGFQPIYPCGIRPDGLFTGAWLGFPNGSIPSGAYPFGQFPNGTFPYYDYFFNPIFDHASLYLALRNNQTEALSNFTSFFSPNETVHLYHHIPTNYTEPFARCFEVYPPSTPPSLIIRESYSSDDQYGSLYGPHRATIDGNLIRAGFWSAQFGAELAMIMAQHSCSGRQRCAYALYLGTRVANVVHSAVDLVSNLSTMLQHGHTDDQGELAIRNVLTLTDVFSLVNEAIYFCAPGVEVIQRNISQGTSHRCFESLRSSFQRTRRVVRRSLDRVAAMAGAIGVAFTAGMGAELTARFIGEGDDTTEQRTILATQIAVAAVASSSFAWILYTNIRRACSRGNSYSHF